VSDPNHNWDQLDVCDAVRQGAGGAAQTWPSLETEGRIQSQSSGRKSGGQRGKKTMRYLLTLTFIEGFATPKAGKDTWVGTRRRLSTLSLVLPDLGGSQGGVIRAGQGQALAQLLLLSFTAGKLLSCRSAKAFIKETFEP